MNISVTDLNINNWKYDNTSTETGIMLVESIQNFKTYFSNVSFDANFKINVNFTRMACDNVTCDYDPRDYGVYNGTLSLQRLNMSLSQKFWVDQASGVRFQQ